jgi:hypothetical protein
MALKISWADEARADIRLLDRDTLCESSMAFIGTRLRDKAVSNLSKARTLADLDFVLATIEFSLGKSTRHFEYCE